MALLQHLEACVSQYSAMRRFRLIAARIVYFAAVLASIHFGSNARAEIADHFPGAEWESVDVAASGWSADKLKDAEAWSQSIGTTALMVIHHGRVCRAMGQRRGQDAARISAQKPLERAIWQRRRAR
jgi:hypothetical protein